MKHDITEIFFLVFVLLLISSTSLIGYENKNINQQNNVFYSYEKDDYFFEFSNDLIYNLNKFYNESGENEFGVCLIGDIDENKIYINDYSKYRIGNKNSIIFDFCNGERELGFLHKHPNHNPNPSYADLYNFFKSFRQYNNTVEIIMYDYSKFEIFTKENWQDRLHCQKELIKLWEEGVY